MNADFPRIITLLRKERGISQKFAAGELEISQALLSHYEKGIRECGLDFLVRAANYYGVSCDYLLGRSPEPAGVTLTVDDLPENEPYSKERIGPDAIIPTLNKKLISNSLHILFSLLQKSKNKSLVKEASSFLMLAVYRMFRIVYSANSKNDKHFFTVSQVIANQSADAAMTVAEAKAIAAVSTEAVEGVDNRTDRDALYITTSALSAEYPQHSSSILNLIQNSEVRIQLINRAEK